LDRVNRDHDSRRWQHCRLVHRAHLAGFLERGLAMPGKLPRFHTAAGKLFDRAKFLDGTYVSYFHPEQWPFGMADNSFVHYIQPTHWPRAGFLLRPPQVVCISFCVRPDSWSDGLAYADKFQGFDYLQIAIDTKVAIENLRSDRTLLGITAYNSVSTTGYWGANLSSFNSNPNLPQYPQSLEYYNSYFNFNYHIGGLAFMMYVVAPNPAEEFFGVDFLHLFVANDTFFVAPYEGIGIADTMTGAYYVPGKTRVINSYNKFARFRVVMYAMQWLNVGFDPVPPPVGGMNTICADLANYGYSCAGVATEEFTVAKLTDLIASHFQFDPDTGKDLPPSSS
jgi:hypothetical protein